MPNVARAPTLPPCAGSFPESPAMLRFLSLARPVLALQLGVLPAAALAQGPGAAPAPVAFTNVTVLTMDGDRRLADHTVIVRDGRIAALGPSASTPVPTGVTRVDGRGKFLMPGLAEMHAHVPPGNPTREQLEDIMFLYVANGITTIRGMLGAPYQIQLKEQLERGAMLGPQFFPAAPSLNGNSAPTPEAAVALVRQAKATGYDLVKIHPGVSRATWDAAVAEMRAQGLTFGGHIPFDVGIVHAMRTGIATIDHVDGYLEAAVRDSAVYAPGSQLGDIIDAVDPAKFPALARMARELQVWNVPTMYLWENFNSSRSGEEIARNEEMKYAPQQWVTGWINQKRNRDNAVAQAGISQADAALEVSLRRQMLKMLADEGAPLLMGTDSPQMFNVPGYALHRELHVAVEAGLSPYQVLESGSKNVGRYVREVLGKDENFGTVAPGQRADLILLDGNPLQNLDNLERLSGVMVRGRWVSGDEITRGLAELERRMR